MLGEGIDLAPFISQDRTGALFYPDWCAGGLPKGGGRGGGGAGGGGGGVCKGDGS